MPVNFPNLSKDKELEIQDVQAGQTQRTHIVTSQSNCQKAKTDSCKQQEKSKSLHKRDP